MAERRAAAEYDQYLYDLEQEVTDGKTFKVVVVEHNGRPPARSSVCDLYVRGPAPACFARSLQHLASDNFGALVQSPMHAKARSGGV